MSKTSTLPGADETSVKRGWSILVICSIITFLVAGSYCQARRVSIEGVGVMIRWTDKVYRYKSDHLDTSSWDHGLIFPKSSIPSAVVGWEYATYDFRPASEDSRTNDQIHRFKASAAGDLLIAMPSAAAAGNGWVRLNSGSSPDYYLDRIGRYIAATPDTNSPYWFYKRSYTTPGTWVSLPVNSVSTNHPPFVFAKTGELYWENPPALPDNGVTLAVLPEGGLATTVANPNLIVMPNGDYLASIGNVVRTYGETGCWRSVDKGVTWTEVASGFYLNRPSVFEHQGSIYLLGANTSGSGATRIYKSSNNGVTWTSSVFAGMGGDDAPSHVDVVNGRIWKAASAGGGPGFFSAPVDADLMQESSWTLSGPGTTFGLYFLANGQCFDSGDEGTLLTTREGILINAGKDSVYRPEDGWQVGISLVQPNLKDITKTTYDPDYAGPRLPGSGSKYTVRYDPVSQKYWAMTSVGDTRGYLNLYSASSTGGRIGDFQLEKTVLEAHSTSYQGFNYPFMQFDGDDIVFTLRTAWDTHRGTATRWHDGNIFTFHRIPNFRGNVPGPFRNPGFENGMFGWSTSGATPWADYTQTLDPHTGSFHLTHGGSSAYQVYTYQTITGLANGIYTLRAWVKNTGGQNACYLNAKDSGGAELRQTLPITETYVHVEIPKIIVTNGQCTIGLGSDANAGNRVTLDDVEFFRVDDCGFYLQDLLNFSSDWLYRTEIAAPDTLHQYHFDGDVLDAIRTDAVDLTVANGASVDDALDTYDGIAGGGPITYATRDPLLLSNFTGADGAFTFEAFIRPEVEYGAQLHPMQIITMDNNSADSTRGWLFGIGMDNTLRFTKMTGTFESQAAVAIPTTGLDAYSAGSWYHVAVTYNGLAGTPDNLKLYWTRADSDITQANLLGSFSISEDLNPAVTSNFSIGNELRSFGGYSENFEGFIDEVRISAVARQPSEMLRHRTSGSLASDFSGDGEVNLVDFALFCAEWMKCGNF